LKWLEAEQVADRFSGFLFDWFAQYYYRDWTPLSERRAQQLIAGSFFLLAAYVGIESVRTLLGGHQPKVSWLGIGLAAFTAPTMPLFAIVKRRLVIVYVVCNRLTRPTSRISTKATSTTAMTQPA